MTGDSDKITACTSGDSDKITACMNGDSDKITDCMTGDSDKNHGWHDRRFGQRLRIVSGRDKLLQMQI